MDPECQVTQLGQGCRGFLCCSVQASSNDRVAIITKRASRDLQLETERNEALLGPIVEIPFDAAPLDVTGLDDAGTRGADLLELGLHFGG